MTQKQLPAAAGFYAAIAAYALWGIMPIYFHGLVGVPTLEIVAHRIIWSVFLLLGILLIRGRLGALWETLSSWRLIAPLMASALLIAANWLLYIWAVQNGNILAASLGYFLNPILNVLLGFAVLKERLSRAQWCAVALAGAGVVVLGLGALSTLWISIALAITFGLYGLIRKMAQAGPMVGLTAETLVLLPIALFGMAMWGANGQLAFGAMGAAIDGLLVSAGVITAVPLLLFAFAARRLRYATIGLIQYIGPTTQMLLGIYVYHEAPTLAHRIAFPLIWGALALYSWSALRQNRSGT
ncbi:MAG: EamA family transporter RarD [Sphingopyxis sp.]